MECRSCHATLPPGVATCPVCGTATPYNIASASPSGAEADETRISHPGREATPETPAQPLQQESAPAQEDATLTGYEPTLRASALPWYAQQPPAASAPATVPFGSAPNQPDYRQPPQQPQPFTQAAYGQSAQPQPPGSSPSQPAYGQPPQQQAPAQSAYSERAAQPSFEIGQAQSFGAPSAQPSFEAPRPRYAQSESFGSPPPQPAYGEAPARPSPYFDQQSVPPFGVPPQQPAPFGQPQSQIYVRPPQQPGYPGEQMQPQPFPVQPQRRPARRLSSMTMLLITLAALVFLIGGSLLLYAGVIHPNQLHAQATSTAQAIQATQVQNTAVAQHQANATATSVAQVTATARALANDPQALYTFATSATPVLNDPLNAQSSTGWSTTKNADGSGCAFTGNALHATTTSGTREANCLAATTTFSDFAYQVQMTITKGDDGGLIFRLDTSGPKIYFFAIGSDGSYLLVTSSTGGQKLLAGGTSPFINRGPNQSNTLTIIARGTAIDLYANKQFITKVDDNSASSGLIGVFASNATSNTTDVAFTNAQVWKL